VGEEGTKGGLWCSPVANTSSPTSSALSATVTIVLIRSCSVGVLPLVGSVVTSPTLKIPNCIDASLVVACSIIDQDREAVEDPVKAEAVGVVGEHLGTGERAGPGSKLDPCADVDR
jgi:hypothetical protein